MPVEIAFNENWSQGMGGSIAVGMRGLEKFDLTGVIVVLCDQPKVDSELLRKLEETSHRGGHAVVASRFGKSLGPPVYFSSQRFADLLNLEAGSGAKSLIQSESSIGFVESPEAEVDLDTPQDLVKLGLHH
jgi:molybdenum cofactor cytidylyltransferase